MSAIGGVKTYRGFKFLNETTNQTANAKATAGIFGGVVVNQAGTTSTIKIYDDNDGTDNLIATLDTTAVRAIYYDVNCDTGIRYTTAGGAAADVTILYL